MCAELNIDHCLSCLLNSSSPPQLELKFTSLRPVNPTPNSEGAEDGEPEQEAVASQGDTLRICWSCLRRPALPHHPHEGHRSEVETF